MHSTAVRAFDDNFVWIARRGNGDPAVIVDPGQAEPVLSALAAEAQPPAAILLTHHHPDHIGGVRDLVSHWPHLRVIAPHEVRIPDATERVAPGDHLSVAGLEFDILDLAAHTTSHIGFFGHGALFCGDALFSLGCGRLFEGSPEDLHRVMETLRQLPPETLLFAAHEYTASNAKFALHVEPSNIALQEYAGQVTELRSKDLDTLPTNLARELACNPFLRADDRNVAAAIDREFGSPSASAVERIGRLRQWKDRYVG